MKTDLKNVKLILLGIITIVIPLLFIFQAKDIEDKKDNLQGLKAEKASLLASNIQKDQLITLLKNYTKSNNIDTAKVQIKLAPVINIPASIDYSKNLGEINSALNSLKPSNTKEDIIKQNLELINIYKKNDSLKKIIESYNLDRIKNNFKNFKAIENKIIEICGIKNTRRKIKIIDSLCVSINKINNDAKWENIFN